MTVQRDAVADVRAKGGTACIRRKAGRQDDRRSLVCRQRGLSRRGFLRRGAGAGALALGASGVGGLLSACSGALATGPVGKPLPLPRPDNPVTWPMYADNQRDQERAAARAQRHAQGLQLGRLRQPAEPEELRQEVQLPGRGHHVQHDDRGAGQAQQRAGQLRRVHGRHRGRDRQGGRREADPAAEPQLPAERRAPGLAGVPEPVLRPALAVHGAVHDLHDRHLLAQGPHPRRPGELAQRLRVPLAVQVRGQGRDPRRLPGVAQPGADEERHLRPEHHVAQPARDRAARAEGPGQD